MFKTCVKGYSDCANDEDWQCVYDRFEDIIGCKRLGCTPGTSLMCRMS
jgi:hypothetical protein